jgi:hypothetical protein
VATQAEDVDTGAETGTDNDTEVQTEAVELNDVEKLAAEMGWKPETNYAGPKDKWKPAEQWLKAERDINRDLKSTVRSLKDTVDRMASTATKQTERALRRQAEEIEGRWNEAVEKGDKAGAVKATKELRELEESAREVTGSEVDYEAAFQRDNPWYGKDEDASAYAVAVSLREANKGRTPEEQLKTAADAVKQRFPELFDEKPARRQPAVHEPSRGNGSRPREKGFADLPPDAKRAAESYAELFKDKHNIDPELSKRDYAKDFFANQGA